MCHFIHSTNSFIISQYSCSTEEKTKSLTERTMVFVTPWFILWEALLKGVLHGGVRILENSQGSSKHLFAIANGWLWTGEWRLLSSWCPAHWPWATPHGSSGHSQVCKVIVVPSQIKRGTRCQTLEKELGIENIWAPLFPISNGAWEENKATNGSASQ